MHRFLPCAVPTVLSIGASLLLMEPGMVFLCGALAGIANAVIAAVVRPAQRKGPFLAGLVGCLMLCALVAGNWPLRAAFLLSRPSLDALARDVREGRQIGPARAGLFQIREVEISRHGIVCLWVDPDTAGKMGFVQCPPTNLGSRFNLWSSMGLDGRWQFVAED